MSEYIWVKPPREGDFEVPLGARVLSRDARRIKVLDDEGVERWIEQAELLRPMHPTSISGVDDMITLGDLQEHAILRNLHLRYYKDDIYTYTGTMLVAVNPYKVLPIYTKDKMALYRGRKIGDLPPHVFAVGDNSYENMRIAEQRQCIVISGESGAGKTESTKLILQYLAALSHKHSWIEQQILDSNPIMEAFGNARTLRNDNSSRFGKYMALHFGTDGAILGSEIQQYLLEKSRLVAQNKGERNYHIFYSLLEGLPRDEKAKLALADASQYRYLNGGETLTCDGRNEAAEFANIMSAMKVLSFSDSDVANIIQLLAAILHLGNLQFKAVSISSMDGSEVIDAKALNRIAELLGTTAVKLGTCLTKKVLATQSDKVTTILSTDQAMETKDAFVKAIYGNLFIYIVEKINQVIKPTQRTSDRYIGVLDIFGFENFENNSFEQLCINLANENLQQFFIRHIFKLEQEQYTNEGVDWKRIQFIDNQAILDMLSVKPMNIMALIDEEAKFPKGTDETMLAKIVAEHESKAEFFRPKYKGISAFGIYHFAGDVYYNVKDFLEKDRDSFSADLRTLAQTSQNRFLQALFPVENALHTVKKKDTLALKFRQSLDQLMAELNQCEPFFVRCIKPNELKKPQIFDRPLCCRQLRYSGMMETAKIRQAGFPIRYTFQEFVERFRVLGKGIPPAHRADCEAATQSICNAVFGTAREYQLGFTKIFLKTKEDIKLDSERQRVLSKYVLVLQKNIRGWLCRRRYKKLRKAAILVQSHWRGRKPRIQYRTMVMGYRRLQACIRSRVLTYRFTKQRKRITALQAYCKGYAIRRWVRQQRQEKSGKLQELMELRRREEAQYRKEGKREWREAAADNWRRRLADLKITIREEEVQFTPSFDEEDEEEQTKLVDNMFGFLDDKQLANSGFSMKELGIGKGLFRDEDYIGLEDGEADHEDYSEYNFRKFATTYFRGNVNVMFMRRPLRHALLESTPGEMDAAARALWITILRFMYDMPEPRFAAEPDQYDAPVMMRITQTLSRKFAKSAAFLDAMAKEESQARRRRLISMTLKKANKLSSEIRQAIMHDDSEDAYTDWLNKRTSNLDKLHFIIGHGILRPELRDEIYAQVCKQLTNNPSKSSIARGWVLLCLCVGCFPPSDLLLKPLKAFLQSGPPGYAQFCLNRLRRTAKNGPRSQPPSTVELQAIKFRKPIDVAVILMDGSSKVVQVDSATTAEELIASLARNTNLKDTFGFGVFVSLDEKVSSLGGGKDHVMDAISQCEQYAREQGHSERSAKWRMYLRKEMFAPWHDASSDLLATNLIYEQIVRGIKSGEYRCEKESDLATLAAQQYYIENGLLNKQKLYQSLHSFIPDHIFRTLSDDKHMRWATLIEDAYNKHFKTRPRIESVRADVVNFARTKWPLLFSRFFEVMELSPNSPLSRAPVIAAINWTGVYFVDQSEQVLFELSYAEIQKILLRASSGNTMVLTLSTIDGKEMMLQGPNVAELHDMIQMLLVQLKKRSKFVVVTQDYKPTEGSHFMQLYKGDLIVLSDPLTGESLQLNSWGEGQNETTGDAGHFPTDCVAIVASAIRPTPPILELLKEGPAAVAKGAGRATIQRMKIYTLEKYAAEHFRLAAARRSTISRATALTSVRQNVAEELWRHSREPLKLPLLRRLQSDEALGTLACNAFVAMLKYMGDQPTRRQRVGTEYTDRVFEPALKHDTLRDEIYCQIMKQLTLNRNKISENRGWELLWLATGMFPCSAELERELTKFLQSRRSNPIAEDCLLRFQRTLTCPARSHPPHQVELEAIQHKHKQIYHRVYFPDDSDEAFEVDSLTRASDLIAAIGKRLDLKSCDGLSLFIKVWNKVLSVPETNYFFDYVRLLTDWIKKNMPGTGEAVPQMQYQVFFMRKLWAGGSVGRDKNADVIFHFPQEVPKYLRGFHKVSKQDATTLAAYISIAKFGKSTAELQSPLTLQQLLPPDLFKSKKPKDWQKEITAAVVKTSSLSKDEAKIEFLKIIQQWPTFGSAFFDVKQTTEPNYPEMILVAINRRGIHIIHPVTKDVLAVHEYTNISNWSSGNTYFTMTIGAMLRGGGTRLLMETPLGYKMDDLISSYASLIHNVSNRRKSVRAPAPPPPEQF